MGDVRSKAFICYASGEKGYVDGKSAKNCCSKNYPTCFRYQNRKYDPKNPTLPRRSFHDDYHYKKIGEEYYRIYTDGRQRYHLTKEEVEANAGFPYLDEKNMEYGKTIKYEEFV